MLWEVIDEKFCLTFVFKGDYKVTLVGVDKSRIQMNANMEFEGLYLSQLGLLKMNSIFSLATFAPLRGFFFSCSHSCAAIIHVHISVILLTPTHPMFRNGALIRIIHPSSLRSAGLVDGVQYEVEMDADPIAEAARRMSSPVLSLSLRLLPNARNQEGPCNLKGNRNVEEITKMLKALTSEELSEQGMANMLSIASHKNAIAFLHVIMQW